VRRTCYRIEPLRPENLEGAVEVHVRSFPGYCLTNLGRRFLRLHYADYLESPFVVGLVAIEEMTGQALGMVVGPVDGPAFDRWASGRNRGRKVLCTFGALFGSVRLWGQLGVRAVRLLVRVLGRLVFRARGRRPPERRAPRAGIQMIGVVPEVRGGGVASDLARAFEEAMLARGVDRLGLSVRTDNARAIHFYEKNGWRCFLKEGAAGYYVKELHGSA